MRRHTTLLLTIVLAATLLPAGAAAAAETTPTIAELEAELVSIVNRERASRGLSTLAVTTQQQRKAREHAGDMARRQQLHHRPDLAGDVFPGDAWTGMAENIVRRRTVAAAHRAFMHSPAHRDNVLGDWTHVGVGIVRDGDELWITQRFVSVRPGHTLPMFTDMPSSAWKSETVVEAWREGILAGCGQDRVCADGRLSRAQTASLLARVLDLEPDVAAAERFRDVSGGSVHAGAIGALAAHGVTLGCDEERYCPDQDVSRAATASLITRAAGWDALDGNRFEDVRPAHTHAGTINRLAAQRVTDGCSSTRYCPSRPVSRVEAARFLSRAF